MAKRKECQPINTVLTTAPKKMLARNCSFRAWKIHFGTWELLSPVIPSRRSIFGPPGKMSSFLRACLIIYPSQMCSAVIDSSLPRHQEHLPMDPSCTRAQVTMTGCAHNCCYLDNIKYKYIYKHSTNTNGIIILKPTWSVGLAPQCLAALNSSKSELWRKWFLNLHKPRFSGFCIILLTKSVLEYLGWKLLSPDKYQTLISMSRNIIPFKKISQSEVIRAIETNLKC